MGSGPTKISLWGPKLKIDLFFLFFWLGPTFFRSPHPPPMRTRGMLDNDILGIDESGLTREAATPSGETYGNLETGLQNPDQISSREKASTCVGRILTGVKELRRNSGLGEAATAELVGRTAIDLSDKPGGDFPI